MKCICLEIDFHLCLESILFWPYRQLLFPFRRLSLSKSRKGWTERFASGIYPVWCQWRWSRVCGRSWNWNREFDVRKSTGRLLGRRLFVEVGRWTTWSRSGSSSARRAAAFQPIALLVSSRRWHGLRPQPTPGLRLHSKGEIGQRMRFHMVLSPKLLDFCPG